MPASQRRCSALCWSQRGRSTVAFRRRPWLTNSPQPTLLKFQPSSLGSKPIATGPIRCFEHSMKHQHEAPAKNSTPHWGFCQWTRVRLSVCKTNCRESNRFSSPSCGTLYGRTRMQSLNRCGRRRLTRVCQPNGGFRLAVPWQPMRPQIERWKQIETLVAGHLVSRQASEFLAWREALRPAKKQLLKPLGAIYRDTAEKGQSRTYATETLADYAAEDPNVLFDLLADAEQFQFRVIFARSAIQQQAIALARQELEKQPGEKASEDEKEALAKRQANTAIALHLMGDHEKVWPVLKFSPDPRVRSYVIHWLAPLGGDPGIIIGRLDGELEVSIRRALLLTLGEFTETQLPQAQRPPVIEKLLSVYENEPDAGLHGAAEWLLRKWGQGDRLGALVDRLKTNEGELQSRKETDKRQWYVNTQGHTFVIVDAGDFLMGSPESEPQRGDDEGIHRRRIGRRFAISTKEVTREQFLRVQPKLSYGQFRRYPEPDCPIGGVLWHEAAAYCNWLNEQEGIQKDQWCYEANEQGKYAEGMKIRENYLELVGYRLPTEAEWECACRAGTLTSRYYGQSEVLLSSYAWSQVNSKNVAHATGSLKPNDHGLFDMLGNGYEWCHGAYLPYEAATSLGGMVAHKADVQPVKDSVSRVLRGGAFVIAPAFVRRASVTTTCRPSVTSSTDSGLPELAPDFLTPLYPPRLVNPSKASPSAGQHRPLQCIRSWRKRVSERC